MQKTDLMELKKLLKKNKVTISRICTCYVTTGEKPEDKEKFVKTFGFLNLPDEEFLKYLKILQKVMSCKCGDTMQTLDLNNEDCRKALDSMRWSELKQEGVSEAFLDKFIESYEEMNSYAVFLFYSAYDIPARGTDKLKQDESDEVYNAIYGAVCPLDVSEPGLALFNKGTGDKEDYEFHNRILDKVVGDPVIGFLYPDYNNKEVNDQKIAYGICNPKKPHNEIPTTLFGSYKEPTAVEQAKMLEEALTETLCDEDAKKIAKVTKNIRQDIMAVTDKIKEDKEYVEYKEDETEEKPTPKIIAEPVISLDNIKESIIRSGIEENKAEKVVESYKNLNPVKTDKLRVDKTAKMGKIKCDKISVSMPAEDMDTVKIEDYNGKRCIIIELPDENAEVSINGIVCKQ